MNSKLQLISLIVVLQSLQCFAQRQWVPASTTAAEMWNPYTWYWPYAIAASESYRDYYVNAQQITNQLYQQAHITQAFPWTTGQAGGAAGQVGQTTGQAGQTTGSTVNPNNPGGQG